MGMLSGMQGWALTVLYAIGTTASLVEGAQTITLRSGNGSPGSQDTQVRIKIYSNNDCNTPSDGDCAAVRLAGAPHAFIPLVPDSAWIPGLESDPAARWIATANGFAPQSALYGIPFEIEDVPIEAIVLDLRYASDDSIHGVYVNCRLVSPVTLEPCDVGHFDGENQFSNLDITSFVQAGQNWLYLNLDNMGSLYVAGVIFSAKITVIGNEFRRGDANDSGAINIADAIFILSHLFTHGPVPSCRDAADANDDGRLDVADAITILSHLFASAGPLKPPFSQCGEDPTEDVLDCANIAPCQ